LNACAAWLLKRLSKQVSLVCCGHCTKGKVAARGPPDCFHGMLSALIRDNRHDIHHKRTCRYKQRLYTAVAWVKTSCVCAPIHARLRRSGRLR
jgi:hypothetical protein